MPGRRTGSPPALRGFGTAASLAAVLCLSGCGGDRRPDPAAPPANSAATEEALSASAEISEAARKEAAAALLPLKKQLLSALTKAMEEGGPEGAIEVCRVKAPEIAAATSTPDIEIGRTSHRLRNPENAPEPWTKAYLDEFLADPAAAAPKARRLEDGRIGYVEPIRILEPCLSCHGRDVSAGVKEKLADLYPEDRATGFENGELRGIFWVKLREKKSG